MINVSFDQLKLTAQVRNISGYENKSKEDLIKGLRETKPETPETPKPEISKPKTPKPEISKPKTPKPEIPKPEAPKLKTLKLKTPKIISSKLKISKLKTPKPKPRPKIRVNKKKLKKLRQDFDELRHKFDKKEIDRYRKAFYDVKNYENLSISKIKKASKSLNKLKKV